MALYDSSEGQDDLEFARSFFVEQEPESENNAPELEGRGHPIDYNEFHDIALSCALRAALTMLEPEDQEKVKQLTIQLLFTATETIKNYDIKELQAEIELSDRCIYSMYKAYLAGCVNQDELIQAENPSLGVASIYQKIINEMSAEPRKNRLIWMKSDFSQKHFICRYKFHDLNWFQQEVLRWGQDPNLVASSLYSKLQQLLPEVIHNPQQIYFICFIEMKKGIYLEIFRGLENNFVKTLTSYFQKAMS